MGKLNSVAIATGNTIATPIRRGGEFANALGNIPRQGYSSVKNFKEVQIQTWNALMDNFLNFSKVEGKWYQKMLKVPMNLISACTRRPAMIAGASVASTINQSIRQPFKKLLLDTPVKLFKGIRNATRIFSTKKGFDFQSYDTYETTRDTWINKIKEKKIGFFTGKNSAKKKDNSVEETKPEAKTEAKKQEIKDTGGKKPVETEEDKKKIIANEMRDIKGFNILGGLEKAQPGDIIIAEDGIKGDSPIFRYNEKNNVYECINYPDSYKGGIEVTKFNDLKKKYKWYSIHEKDKKNKITTTEKPTSINEHQQQEKEVTKQKEAQEKAKNFPQWETLDDKFKAEYKKEYDKILKGKLTTEGIIARGKKAKMGDNPEEIIKNLKEKEPTFAGYLEEILKKEKKDER